MSLNKKKWVLLTVAVAAVAVTVEAAREADVVHRAQQRWEKAHWHSDDPDLDPDEQVEQEGDVQ